MVDFTCKIRHSHPHHVTLQVQIPTMKDILTESKGSLVIWHICLKEQSDSGQGSQTSQTFKIENLTGQELSMGVQKRSSLLTSLSQEESM